MKPFKKTKDFNEGAYLEEYMKFLEDEGIPEGMNRGAGYEAFKRYYRQPIPRLKERDYKRLMATLSAPPESGPGTMPESFPTEDRREAPDFTDEEVKLFTRKKGKAKREQDERSFETGNLGIPPLFTAEFKAYQDKTRERYKDDPKLDGILKQQEALRELLIKKDELGLSGIREPLEFGYHGDYDKMYRQMNNPEWKQLGEVPELQYLYEKLYAPMSGDIEKASKRYKGEKDYGNKVLNTPNEVFVSQLEPIPAPEGYDKSLEPAMDYMYSVKPHKLPKGEAKTIEQMFIDDVMPTNPDQPTLSSEKEFKLTPLDEEIINFKKNNKYHVPADAKEYEEYKKREQEEYEKKQEQYADDGTGGWLKAMDKYLHPYQVEADDKRHQWLQAKEKAGITILDPQDYYVGMLKEEGDKQKVNPDYLKVINLPELKPVWEEYNNAMIELKIERDLWLEENPKPPMSPREKAMFELIMQQSQQKADAALEEGVEKIREQNNQLPTTPSWQPGWKQEY